MQKIKSQIIVPNTPEESDKIAFVLSSADNPEHKKDSNYFLLCDFASSKKENTQVFKKIIHDTFTHILTLDDSAPVLQILEKATRACKEAADKFSQNVVFNVVAAVFVDDFVHISIYGDAKALYLDGTSVMPMNTAKEGKYAGVSEKVLDGKVIILCSLDFYKNFPPKTLVSLTKPILSQDLDSLSSAVILKVDMEKKVQLQAEPASQEPKPVPTGNSVGGHKLRRFVIPLALSLAVLALIGGVLVLRNRLGGASDGGGQKDQESSVPPLIESTPNAQVEPKSEVKGELSKKLDEANKVKRVVPEVFYDISIVDSKAAPTELALGLEYVAVADAIQGKIYVSSLSVAKFEELPQLFPEVKTLSFTGTFLTFSDREGIKYYDLAKKAVVNSYFADAVAPITGASIEYSGFTYGFFADKLLKYAKVGNGLKGVVWAQESSFADAVSLGIDGSIYILFKTGDIAKYTGGVKEDFTIVGLDKNIQKPFKLLADSAFKQFYVGDGAEGRLLAFDSDGVLSFQLKPEEGSEWIDLRSFGISADEKTFFTLVGTKVYEFSL